MQEQPYQSQPYQGQQYQEQPYSGQPYQGQPYQNQQGQPGQYGGYSGYNPAPADPYSGQQFGQNQPYAQSPYQAMPQMQYASVGPRFLALLIDAIIVGAGIGILEGIGAATQSAALASIFGLIGGVAGLLYYFGLEATRGATFGKQALGLRVVKENGSPIGWSESIIRNLLRVVDGLFVYLVGAILVWNSPKRQRLGDMAAHTVVIKTR